MFNEGTPSTVSLADPKYLPEDWVPERLGLDEAVKLDVNGINVTIRRSTSDDFIPMYESDGTVRQITWPITQYTFQRHHVETIGRAVEEFDAAYPGWLPKDIEVVSYWDDRAQEAARVLSVRAKDHHADPTKPVERIVWVNLARFDEGLGDPSRLEGEGFQAFVIARRHDSSPMETQKRLIMHEFAHVVEHRIPRSISDSLPAWDDIWHAGFVDPQHPRIPSQYASANRAEYFAETLSDRIFPRSTGPTWLTKVIGHVMDSLAEDDSPQALSDMERLLFEAADISRSEGVSRRDEFLKEKGIGNG